MARKKIHGVDKVLRNLNREIQQIEGLTMKGLIRAAAIVRQSMDKNTPMIPWDTGNLAGSWFTDPQYQGQNPVVRLGFTANYAWYVHEMVGANFRQPKEGAKGGGQRGAKFFEAALNREREAMLDIIKKEAKK